MGWNCSINLYLPATNLGAALIATSKVMELTSTVPCEILLPNGECLSLPFGQLGDPPPRQVVVGRERTKVDIVLKVPVDAVIDEWWDAEPYIEDGCRYVGIGLVNLYLSAGPRYAEMSFYAPTGDMSYVIDESRAVHSRLLWVLHDSGGLAGVIVPDDGSVRLLSDPSVELKINWNWVNVDGDPDPERLAEEVIRQSGGPA